MLLAEDLLLLLTDDRTGRLAASGNEVDVALGGALLVELSMLDRVEVLPRSGMFRSDRVEVDSAAPLGDEILDEALARLAAKPGRRATDAVALLGKKVRRRLYDRLVAKGVLRVHRGKVLGVIPIQQWPAENSSSEDEVRRRLALALQHGQAPDARSAALVSLLHALRRTHKAVRPHEAGMSRRELSAAAKRIAEGDWASAAVRRPSTAPTRRPPARLLPGPRGLRERTRDRRAPGYLRADHPLQKGNQMRFRPMSVRHDEVGEWSA